MMVVLIDGLQKKIQEDNQIGKKCQSLTMYIQNRLDGTKFKGCNPLQHRKVLISLKPVIAYFAYNQRYDQLNKRRPECK